MTENQDYCAEIMRRINSPEHFGGRNGILITEFGDGWAKGEMENSKATQNQMGGVHGGALSTLADIVAAMSVSTMGRRRRVTLHNTMHYMRQACPGKLSCEAHVRKTGRTIAVSEATVMDADGAKVAIGTFTFYFTE